MSRFYRGGVALKPENAVKRADELVGVSNGTSSAPMARRAARRRPFWSTHLPSMRRRRPRCRLRAPIAGHLTPLPLSARPTQVGQKGAALQTLHDTITNRRYQRNWTKALEAVRLEGLARALDHSLGAQMP